MTRSSLFAQDRPAHARAGFRARITRASSLTLLLIVIGVAGGVQVAVGQTRVRRTAERPALYWGAAIGPQITGEQAPWSQTAVDEFESEVGAKMSIQPIGWTMGDCSGVQCDPVDLPAAGLTMIRRDGAIPMINFLTAAEQDGAFDADFSTNVIADGTLDSWIRQEAEQLKAWGHPVFFRFDWEMNGDWFPWSAGNYGDTAASYVAAWRRFYDIFQSVGARNVTWVWCPNIRTTNDPEVSDPARFYPGKAYVDWTCMDVYNQGSLGGGKFVSFGDLASRSYREITEKIAPSKPMMIGEFASTQYGGSKGTWIKNAFTSVRQRFPKIRAMVYWDSDDDPQGINWNIEGNENAIDGFREGVATPAYERNVYARFRALSTQTILPPILREP